MDKQMPSIITAAQVEEFKNKGVLVIPGFYDLEEDVRPIQQGIYDLIGLIIGKYRLESPTSVRARDLRCWLSGFDCA